MLNTKSTAVLSLLLPRTWRVSSACRGDNLCSKRVLYTFACSYGGVRKPQLASPFPFSARAPPRSKLTRVQANASYTMERETGTLLPGRAQASETTEFAKSFRNAGEGHFRSLPTHNEIAGELKVSSLGLGTYLGPESDSADSEYSQAILKAFNLGINLLDTAVNYRSMRSERAVGNAVATALAQGIVTRNQVVVCTKGGYFTFDGNRPANPRQWIQENFVAKGIFSWSEFAAGCHCMTPAYLKNQLEISRKNLGLETIDIYYVHNPETQLTEVLPDVFKKRICDAFGALEEACAEGKISAYGVATWNGFRVPYNKRGHLSLEDLVHAAEDAAGGEGHHFRVIQLPFNLSLTEAETAATQIVNGKQMSLLDAARQLNISVVASASLMQAQLCNGLPEEVRGVFSNLGNQPTDAQCALQFVRTTPGITTALAGMRSVAHVEENAGIIPHSATPR
ncbi:hypothetical protein CY35_08G112000 [Sphagnum magellanicum]|nr:hypothetical protein CY35_08G112000 [Sphagnum magellanicum]